MTEGKSFTQAALETVIAAGVCGFGGHIFHKFAADMAFLLDFIPEPTQWDHIIYPVGGAIAGALGVLVPYIAEKLEPIFAPDEPEMPYARDER